jgi:RNA polymerase sigma-70 factor, ECF subfamily
MAINVKEKISLSKLMKLAQGGDKQAYSSLFLNISPLLRSYVSKKISNPADMEDIVQEILISIHKAGHTFDTDRPFEIWMYTIARYRLNDFLRAYYKKESLRNKVFDESEYFTADNNVTNDSDISESINELLDGLPEKQRTIVTMMKIDGYTAKETAEKVNMSETAVKVAAHRIYKKFEKKIKKVDE